MGRGGGGPAFLFLAKELAHFQTLFLVPPVYHQPCLPRLSVAFLHREATAVLFCPRRCRVPALAWLHPEMLFWACPTQLAAPVQLKNSFVVPPQRPEKIMVWLLMLSRGRVLACRLASHLIPWPPPPRLTAPIRGKEKLQGVRAGKTASPAAGSSTAKAGDPGGRDAAGEAEEEKEEAARSEMLEINEFLFRAGLDNVNLFKLQRYMRRSEISRKVRGKGGKRREAWGESYEARGRWRRWREKKRIEKGVDEELRFFCVFCVFRVLCFLLLCTVLLSPVADLILSFAIFAF